MGEFDEFITGLMELEVAGKKLKLLAKVEDKRKLKLAQVDEQMSTEQKLALIDDTYLKILKQSYPHENKEALENFYNANDIEFMKEFMIKVGWQTKEDFNSAQKSLQEKSPQ